ncbi:MAG TPA: hypothetical protein VGH80_14475 [Xanthomonadaceae bacterium]
MKYLNNVAGLQWKRKILLWANLFPVTGHVDIHEPIFVFGAVAWLGVAKVFWWVMWNYPHIGYSAKVSENFAELIALNRNAGLLDTPRNRTGDRLECDRALARGRRRTRRTVPILISAVDGDH